MCYATHMTTPTEPTLLEDTEDSIVLVVPQDAAGAAAVVRDFLRGAPLALAMSRLKRTLMGADKKAAWDATRWVFEMLIGRSPALPQGADDLALALELARALRTALEQRGQDLSPIPEPTAVIEGEVRILG